MASLSDKSGVAAGEGGDGGGGGGGTGTTTPGTFGRSKDDAYLLKIRADEFRAGYSNWRQHGVNVQKGKQVNAENATGAKGEITGITVAPGEGAEAAKAGEAGYRSGYKNWRQGKSSGARGDAGAVKEGQVTANTGAGSGGLSMSAAADAAARGENWTQFFLHPGSDFHSNAVGARQEIPLTAANLPAIAHNLRSFAPETATGSGRASELGADEAKYTSDEKPVELSQVPAYPRSVDSFENIICHIGVGGFHRSHEAMYMNQLLLQQDASSNHTTDPTGRWAIVGIGLMPWDNRMREALEAQDCCYTLVTRSPAGSKAQVIGSIVDFVYAPEDRKACVERLASPQCKIVSLTVTEKGYCLNVDNKLDLDNALVAHDLATPDEPQSAVGLIVAALKLRRERGEAAFTVLSCDNLPGNGELSRLMTMAYLDALGDADLKTWVEANGKFVNTMVDRITPITKPEHIDLVKVDYGVDDKWPVIAEDYAQWVVEDQFVNGLRPDLESAGVLVVPDVHPYELMKLRLLNAGHSALSYVSYLCGHRFVDAAMNDPNVTAYLMGVFDEHSSTLSPVPGVDIPDYIHALIARFSNPYIKDTVQRLAEDGSMKLVTTMRDPAVENLKAGKSTDMFSFTVATWIRYLVGKDEEGNEIEIKDPAGADAGLLDMAKAICHADDAVAPTVVLAPTDKALVAQFVAKVFGTEAGSSDQIVDGVFTVLVDICTMGTAARLQVYMDSKA